MKITHEFSPEILKQGMAQHFAHRKKALNILLTVFGLFAIGYGIITLLSVTDGDYFFGTMLVLVGIFYLLRSKLRISASVKSAFKGNAGTRQITIEASEDFIEMTDGSSQGTQPWESFVDFRHCEHGILLYPQENMFYWIPKNANIENGSWEDLTQLISSKVTKKL